MQSSARIYQTQHSKADALESQQTPAASHVTYAIPGEAAGIRVMLGDCDQKCSASPQLSKCHPEAPTALPCLSSANRLPGLSGKRGSYWFFFYYCLRKQVCFQPENLRLPVKPQTVTQQCRETGNKIWLISTKAKHLLLIL